GNAPAAIPCGQLHSECDLSAAGRVLRRCGAGPLPGTEDARERHGRAVLSGTRVTASGAVPAAAAGAAPRGAGARSWAVPAVIIAATLLAVGLRLYDLSRPGYLLGISEYDDGTDFGSAIRLVHGAVPYRDFIMVQPPGITLIMFPIALITKGMG